KPQGGRPVQPAHVAVQIAYGAMEKEPLEPRESRRAHVAVQGGHGPLPELAAETVSHDELVSLSELVQEGREIAEVVAVVGISDDEVPASCDRDTTHHRAAVAPPSDAHHPSAEACGDVLGSVGAPVVGDDDLTGHAQILQGPMRLADQRPEGPLSGSIDIPSFLVSSDREMTLRAA